MKFWLTPDLYFDFRAIWNGDLRYHRRDSEAMLWFKYLGWGLVRVEEIRQGFWMNERNEVVVGFFPSESNFHYARLEGEYLIWYRSNYDTPKPALIPISFEDGIRLMLRNFGALRLGDKMLQDLDREK